MTPEELEFIGTYSKFELTEMYYWSQNLLALQMSLIMTVLFAYLALVYFVGKKLGRFEILSATVIYTVFFFYTLSSFAGNLRLGMMIADTLMSLDSMWNVYAMPLLMSLGWATSVYYMYRTRREDEA